MKATRYFVLYLVVLLGIILTVFANKRYVFEDDEDDAIQTGRLQEKRGYKHWLDKIMNDQWRRLGTMCSSHWKCEPNRCNLATKRCCAPHGFVCRNDDDCCSKRHVCDRQYNIAVCRNPYR
ncbi:uncharacterized protein LOC141914071 isoform X2 [Tubulanus polymorphus]|uniref:uncharacterized protein LOC141914071 isoform X2 n=1 Tax=Tubulanus polymorphus TaxID=672921 RepID=UPI003DA40E35